MSDRKQTMHLARIDRDRCQEAYDILCHGAFPWNEVRPPFGATWCVVEPRKTCRAHKHQEHEVFFIARGEGVMRVDGETRRVRAGDTVFMKPFQVHEITNSSDTEDLLILDLIWERMEEAGRVNRGQVDARSGHRADVFITATPPVTSASPRGTTCSVSRISIVR